MKSVHFRYVLFSLFFCFVICVPAYAASPDHNSVYVESPEVLGSSLTNNITMDDLIAHSTITYADDTSMSGHYDGDSTIAVVDYGSFLGAPDFFWTHTVVFDWTAKVNSEGDYIFDTITNANSSVSPDTHLLYLDVESRELKDQYSFSSDRRSVTFDSSYELQWQFYNEPFTTTATANLKRVIEMQDLI